MQIGRKCLAHLDLDGVLAVSLSRLLCLPESASTVDTDREMRIVEETAPLLSCCRRYCLANLVLQREV
jgi:hypothetical protein